MAVPVFAKVAIDEQLHAFAADAATDPGAYARYGLV
jgi:hypothetical protein